METEKTYYNIVEVSEMIGVNASALRFWEKEFTQIKPKTSKRGVRSYTKKDIDIIKEIKYLKDCGYTLDGIRKIFKTQKLINGIDRRNTTRNAEIINKLEQIKTFLLDLKQKLQVEEE